MRELNVCEIAEVGGGVIYINSAERTIDASGSVFYVSSGSGGYALTTGDGYWAVSDGAGYMLSGNFNSTNSAI